MYTSNNDMRITSVNMKIAQANAGIQRNKHRSKKTANYFNCLFFWFIKILQNVNEKN